MGSAAIINRTRFNRQTILLVEDNDDDAFLMQCVFRKSGVSNPLQVVSDGEEAIAYLKGETPYTDRQKYPRPVLVLLDLNMPRKNGLEVLQWIRQQPELKRTTIYILTASSRSVDVKRAFDLGANAYIVKPSKVEALVKTIQTWHAFAQINSFPPVG
jgi:CheY-like chemotaxis protein